MLAHFGPAGAKTGLKWGKTAHLVTKGHEHVQIRSYMIIDMRNLLVPSVFRVFKYLAYFVPARGKTGLIWGKTGHLLTNGHENVQIRSYMIIDMRNLLYHLFSEYSNI